MRTIITLALSLCPFLTLSQEPELNHIKGYRVQKDIPDQPIYADKQNSINKNDWRKLNYQVYFRIVNVEPIKVGTITYQMITIPGKAGELDQNEKERMKNGEYPLSGKTVSAKDYDQNFWVDETVIKTMIDQEHFQYENDAFSGILVAPFKLRLAAGSSTETFIDGSFNVSTFLGWKFRLSDSKPYFVSPFAFGGITTLNYTSSDNHKITDPSIKESGAGVTYGGGIAFRFNKISPGFVFGFDHGFGNLGNSFNYNDKIWISFSLNFEFFKPQEAKETSRINENK